MSRTIIKIICIVSGILFVVLGAVTFYSVSAELNSINTNGIIGGAGAPTVEFLLQTSPTFYAANRCPPPVYRRRLDANSPQENQEMNPSQGGSQRLAEAVW